MKIVHLVNYFNVGRGYQEYFLAKEQIKNGHQVSIITSNRLSYAMISVFSKNEQKEKQRIIESGVSNEEGITVYRLPILFEIFPRVYLRKLKKTLAEIEPDVVHCHSISTIIAFQVACLKKKYRLIYDDHMIFCSQKKNIIAKLFYFLLKNIFIKKILAKGDAFIAVSSETKLFMHKEYGIPLSKINIIELGADKELFRFDQKSREEVRSNLNIGKNDIVVIYAGKITPEKGPLIILESLIDLIKEKKICILIVGNGEEEYVNKIKSFVKKNYIQNKIFWHDYVKNLELYKFFSAADIAVWPKEAAVSMIEAASCGLPIIISNSIPGIKNRISNNNGLAYKEGDLSDLRNCVKLLVKDPSLRIKMGMKGRELIEREFSWEKQNQKFLKIYKQFYKKQ
jgi:glycosyltransferase involved in cell wall biosynthesis